MDIDKGDMMTENKWTGSYLDAHQLQTIKKCWQVALSHLEGHDYDVLLGEVIALRKHIEASNDTPPPVAAGDTLNPCPFCGGEADVTIESSYYQVMCKDEDGCTALGLFGHVDRATAIREWNRRAVPTMPLDSLRYVTNNYLLSSSSKPLGDREEYAKHMMVLHDWLKDKVVPTMPQPDWANAPDEAQWWAVDANGDACWYADRPCVDGIEWFSSRGDFDFWHRTDKEVDLPIGVDWRATLQRRPGVGNE